MNRWTELFSCRTGSIMLAFAIIPLVFVGPALGQEGTLFVEGDDVGIGTATPKVSLHVQGSDGTTQLQVEELSSTPASRTGLFLINNGGVRLGYLDRSTGVLWAFNNVGGRFIANAGGSPNELVVDSAGNLTISGSLTTASSTVPDFVFDPSYQLMPLDELAEFVERNRRLPNIPSAREVEKQGTINVTDFQMKLLEKVEELSLYVLEQNREIRELQALNAALKERIDHMDGERQEP